MKPLLASGFLLLVSCTAARRTTINPDGSVVLENGGQLGGNYTIAYTRTPRGGVKFVEDISNEKSYGDTVQAGALAFGSYQARLADGARVAADTAIATGAQDAAVAGQKIAADEAVSLGEQATKRALTIPK